MRRNKTSVKIVTDECIDEPLDMGNDNRNY